MVQQQSNIADSLENVQDYMRPWMYNLIRSRLYKAIDDEDAAAIDAFTYPCNTRILWCQSDVEMFTNVRSRLEESPHKDSHVEAIRAAFTEHHGEIEGF